MMPKRDNRQTHVNFDASLEVVADPLLSMPEKARVPGDLEEDALQLAIASSEGMSGGEPTALAEMLQAKEVLELPPIDFAYDLVMTDLETRRLDNDGDAGLIAQAVAALKALQKLAG